MALKLCVATPWCVLILQGRRTKVNPVQLYSVSFEEYNSVQLYNFTKIQFLFKCNHGMSG